jgi:hypothetical protein
LIPAKFHEKYSELAVGRRRRRQDVVAEEAQQVSAVGLESSLWCSETWAGKRSKILQKKYRKITFAEDLESYFQDDK